MNIEDEIAELRKLNEMGWRLMAQLEENYHLIQLMVYQAEWDATAMQLNQSVGCNFLKSANNFTYSDD